MNWEYAAQGVDRSMLAGVRVPEGVEKGKNELVDALLGLAEKYDAPVYEWPAALLREDQRAGLLEPFAGEWVENPETGRFTSSLANRFRR